jgi:cell division protein FtsL
MMRLLLIALLGLGIFVSATSIVLARHEARKAFIQQQTELQRRDALNLDWVQLQLELATWATPARIETSARERLGMLPADVQRIIFVLEDPAWVR